MHCQVRASRQDEVAKDSPDRILRGFSHSRAGREAGTRHLLEMKMKIDFFDSLPCVVSRQIEKHLAEVDDAEMYQDFIAGLMRRGAVFDPYDGRGLYEAVGEMPDSALNEIGTLLKAGDYAEVGRRIEAQSLAYFKARAEERAKNG
jgi:hypothetical protein